MKEYTDLSGKEAEWMERNLCRNTFPFDKTFYASYIFF